MNHPHGMPRVLFVCTGNLCRSPIAEGIARARLHEAGFGGDLVASAGIHALADLPPPVEAINVAAQYGADISMQRSRAFEPADFARFDHLIAMDLGHLDFLQATRPPASAAAVRLLLEDIGEMKRIEVPDPFRQGIDAFEVAARLIDLGVNQLLAEAFGLPTA